MKKISKTNEEIYSLIERVKELSDYEAKRDFNMRGDKICANIKVYEYLGEDDVIQVCKRLGVKKVKKVVKEFNEDRLNSIHDHTCEMEVDYIKEQYEGNVDLTDYEKIFRVGRIAIDNLLDRSKVRRELAYYADIYWDKALRFKTFEGFKKYIIKDNDEYIEFYKRSLIDFGVWQYGRSGGWLSICSTDELNFTGLLHDYVNIGWRSLDDLEYAYKEDINKVFNSVLLEEGYGYKEKAKLVKELESAISYAEEKIEAVEYFISKIEESVKGFKDCLLSNLEHEIETYLQDVIKEFNVTIKVENDTVKTSMGVSVPLQKFKDAFALLSPKIEKIPKNKKMDINMKVGSYFVEYAKKKKDDFLVKAGCHRFSYNQIKQALI